MTKVVFETAVLADAIANAVRIAPLKGREVEMYAGFYIEVRPNEEHSREVNIRAANGTVFYTEYMEAVEIEGEAVDWRIPSVQIAAFLRSLPSGAGKQVTLEEVTGPSGVGHMLRVSQRRSQCQLSLLVTEYYPDWDLFNEEDTTPVQSFGERIQQVSWAAAKDDMPPVNGVHIDGERLVATNKIRIATVPCEVNLGENNTPVTVPASMLAPLISQMVDIRVGIVGNFLCMAPNDYTQIKCVLLADQFPNCDNALNMEHPDVVLFNRDQAVEMANRVLAISTDRQQALDITIGEEEIQFYAKGETSSESTLDYLDILGQADHTKHLIRFGPENLLDALSKAPNKEVMMWYTQGKPKRPVKIDGGSGYTVIIQPRAMTSDKAE